MKRLCCPGCRLRFTRVEARYLAACPECGLLPKPVDNSESLIGFRLLTPQGTPEQMPAAVAIALADPAPDRVQ